MDSHLFSMLWGLSVGLFAAVVASEWLQRRTSGRTIVVMLVIAAFLFFTLYPILNACIKYAPIH